MRFQGLAPSQSMPGLTTQLHFPAGCPWLKAKDEQESCCHAQQDLPKYGTPDASPALASPDIIHCHATFPCRAIYAYGLDSVRKAEFRENIA